MMGFRNVYFHKVVLGLSFNSICRDEEKSKFPTQTLEGGN